MSTRTLNTSSPRGCKSAWSMPRDNTPHHAIYAYIRSLIHPNGPEAYCFHAVLRRSIRSSATDVAGKFACVCHRCVAWHSIIDYLLQCSLHTWHTRAHTQNTDFTKRAHIRFASYFHEFCARRQPIGVVATRILHLLFFLSSQVTALHSTLFYR